MEYFGEFITIALVAFLGAVSPGPDFIMVTKNSLTYNRKIGFFTGIGVGSGTLIHVFYTLVGIGVIVSQSIIAYSMIKYLGAAYLIYLGYKSLRAKKETVDSKEFTAGGETQNISQIRQIRPSKAFRQGFLCNALNPKATVFFLSVFTQIINPHTPLAIQVLLGIECTVIITLWFAIVALIFSNESLKNKIRGVKHYIERAMGVVLVLLGLKIATESRR